MAGLVGSLLVSLQAKTDQFEQGMAKARKEVQTTADVVAKGSVRFEGLGKSMLGLAAGVASLATLKQGLDSVIASGTKMQQLTSAFTIITGSAQGSDKALALVRATADRLGLSFTELADGFKGIAAASKGTSLEGEGIARVFQQVVTAGKALQLSGEDTRGILLALQQIMSRGTVTAEDFNQISERLPGALNAGARAVGVTTAEFAKMREQGQLLANSFIVKFGNQLEKDLGGANVRAKDFASSMARLGSATFDAGAMVAKGGLLDWLGTIADKLAAVVKAAPEAQRALENLAKSQTEKDFATQEAAGFPGNAAQKALIKSFNDQLVAKQAEMDAVRKSPPMAFGPSGLEDVSARVLNQLDKELKALEKAKAELLKSVGRAAERVGAQDEGMGGILGSRYKAARDLEKTILEKSNQAAEEFQRQEQRLTLAPDAEARLGILKQQAELLTKARDDIQTLLARAKELQPLLPNLGKDVDATDLVTGKPQPLRVTVGSELAGIQAALEQVRSQIDETARLAVQGDIRESNFDALVAKVKSFGQQLIPVQASILAQTETFIADYNRLHGAAPIGPATQALLRQQAARLDDNARFLTEARELETTLTSAYEGMYDQVLMAGVATEEEVGRTLERLRSKTAAVFDAIDQQAERGINASRRLERASEDVAGFALATVKGVASGDIRGDDSQQIAQAIRALRAGRDRVLQAEAEASGHEDPAVRSRQTAALTRLRQEYADLTQAVKAAQSAHETAFEKIAKAFQRMVLDVAFEALNLKEILGKALREFAKDGGGWLGNLFKGNSGGASFTTTGATGSTLAGSEAIIAGAGLASGGPVVGGNPYPVGERGWEMFVPSVSGRVLSHDDTMDALVGAYGNGQQPGSQGPTVINMTYNISTPDATSFQRSRGELDARALQFLRNATRAA